MSAQVAKLEAAVAAETDRAAQVAEVELDTVATLFWSVHDKEVERCERYWSDIVATVRKPTQAKRKEDLPLWTLADFGDKRSPRGALRNNANVVAIHGVIGDYDDGKVSMVDAATLAEAAGIRAVFHTTPSHTSGEPRWRALVPLSHACSPAEHERFTRRLDRALGGSVLARESLKLAQIYYFGAVEGVPYEYAVTFDDPYGGTCIDLLDELDGAEPQAQRAGAPAQQSPTPHLPDPREFERERPRIETALAFIKSEDYLVWIDVGLVLFHASGGSIKAFEVWATWSSSSEKYKPDEAKAKWASFPTDRLSVLGLGTLFKLAKEGGWDEGAGGVKRAVIRIDESAIARMADEADAALAKVDVFSSGGNLVRVVKSGALDADRVDSETGEVLVGGVRREAGTPMTRLLTTAGLTDVLSRVVVFERFVVSAKGFKPTRPPENVVSALLVRGEWHGARPLAGIVDGPVLRWDGSIVDRLGYDPATALLRVGDEFPPVPEAPTRDDALRALEGLRQLLAGFPFAEPVDEAAALSLLFTLIDRSNLDIVPAFFVTASAARTGKTLLADVLGIIATGRTFALMTWPADDAEVDKRITAMLIAGDRGVLFDNLPTGSTVYSPAMCNTITSRQCKARILGESRNWVGTSSLTFVATGNNIGPAKDMVARAVEIRLRSTDEHPEHRIFPIDDLRGYAREHYAELRVAVLTILRAWAVACRKEPALSDAARVLGDFSQWRRRIASAMVWLGLPDPIATQDRHVDIDADREQDCALLEALYAVFGEIPWLAREPFAASAPAYAVGVKEGVDPAHTRALSVALRDLAPDCQTPAQLGVRLNRLRELPLSGLVVERTGKDRSGAVLWRVRRIG